MPGADDPCNYLLPQQPFHPCMLPQASQLATLNLCTNPYCCDIDGVRVLGTAGQPLDDMQRCLPGDDRLKTLQRSLEFQHLAPTAPDTLGCYPFANKEEDPFVVRQCPHIFFAGNQPRYESKIVEGADGQRVLDHGARLCERAHVRARQPRHVRVQADDVRGFAGGGRDAAGVRIVLTGRWGIL